MTTSLENSMFSLFSGGRQFAQQVANILDKAEIEHAIGLIQHRDLYLVQFENALFVVIDYATGACQ